MEEVKTYIGSVDNFGAIGILALLIFRLPQILQIMNDGKKEVAQIITENHNRAYASFKEALDILQRSFEDRYEKVYRNQEKLEELMIAQGKVLESLAIKSSMEKK